MAMKPLFSHTRREKLGIIDGINLFFGALLGANLGTVGGMPLTDYVVLIALLASLVMAIRMTSVSERRLYAYVMLALCAAIFLAILLVPAARPDGLEEDDLNRLIATILIWIAATSAVDFYPDHDSGEDQAGT